MIPAYELDLLRQHPQSSDIYMIIQQPERFTEAEYMSDRRWIDYIWSCRVHVDPATDPVYNLSVDTSSGNANLLDGMTVLIGSTAYGEWDRGIIRLRTDQVVNAGTNVLTIAPASEFRGRVKKGDYVVVLDEFRMWQRFSRVETVAGVILWYKDWDLRWINIGANDVARRLAMLPPVPIMGPHAVKFVDPPNINSQFWFDWSNSYPTAQGAAMATWASWGQQDFAGNTWTSVAQIPGWEQTKGISGLRGFRVVLEVNDGNGNALTLPYRRGVRYVFTLRRPGQKQPGDPENAEPIVNFSLNESVAGSFSQGYWRTSVTISHEEADKYAVLPGALVILFTDDWYMADSPYLSPKGMRNVSLGPIYDRENILLVGRVADGSITVDPETNDVTFEVLSTGQEAANYENVPIVVQDKIDSLDWIDVPNLTVDRAAHMYIAWHTTMSLVADVYQTGDTHTLYAMDFTASDIYSTINNFYWDRIFARLLCDKYGRFFCEVDVQMSPYGTVDTLWVLDDGDWLDNLDIKHYEVSRCKAAECGGVTYIGGSISAVLSRAPGTFDKYRGAVQPSNYLAVNDQAELNILSGRFLEYQNYEWEIGIQLAGNWRHLDIVPQAATYADIDAERGTIDGRLIIRNVSNDFNGGAGCIFTSIQTEIEEDDGVPGVTIVVPADLPDIPPPPRPHDGNPPPPGGGTDTGRRIMSTGVGILVTDEIGSVSPHWYLVNAGIAAGRERCWKIIRDPYHWWTSGGTERTLWGIFSRATTGMAYYIYKHELFPYGTWVEMYSAASTPGVGAAPFVADIVGSIESDGLLFALACNGDAGFGSGDMYVAKTINGGLAWTHPGLVYNPTFPPAWINPPIRNSSIDLGAHSGGQMIYAAVRQFVGEPIVRRSLDGGVNWVAPGQPGFMDNYGALRMHIPYVSPAWTDTLGYLITVVSNGVINIARSANLKAAAGAVTWAQRGCPLGGGDSLTKFHRWFDVCFDNTDHLALALAYPIGAGSEIVIFTSEDAGVTWTEWVRVNGIGRMMSSAAFFNWNLQTLESMLCHDPDNSQVLLITQAGAANKTGDLYSVAPTLDYVTMIDRDSMGAA